VCAVVRGARPLYASPAAPPETTPDSRGATHKRVSRTVAYLIAHALTLTPLLPLDAAAQVEIAGRAARITVGGRLHTQFATTSVEGVPGRFFHRRARIQADVRVGDFLDGRVEPDFAGGRATLQDAWARLTFDPALAVSLGQFKRAFSGIELASSTDMSLIERDGAIPGQGCAGVGDACSFSRLTQQLGHDGRDLGIRLEGTLLERLSYTGTVTNGQGGNAAEMNDAKSFSGRLQVGASDRVQLGVFAGLHDHRIAPDVEDTQHAAAFGADLEVGTWRGGLHLLAGIVAGENWRAGPDADFLAVQALATYYAPVDRTLLVGVEPLLRAGWADPDRDAQDVAGLLLTPGVMLYFEGKNGISLNLDAYSPDGEGDAEWSLKVQGYLFF
jgi:hypothetical protein